MYAKHKWPRTRWVNEQNPTRFPFQSGTRQGLTLPSSPFVVFTEPLLAAIWQNNIIGNKTANVNQKISLYADNVLHFLQSAQISLSLTITLINKYSIISDYSINWKKKSPVLPIHLEFQSVTNPLQSWHINYPEA